MLTRHARDAYNAHSKTSVAGCDAPDRGRSCETVDNHVIQRRTGGPFSPLLASRSPVPADHYRSGVGISAPHKVPRRIAATVISPRREPWVDVPGVS
jgi:hypothetical protein